MDTHKTFMITEETSSTIFRPGQNFKVTPTEKQKGDLRAQVVLVFDLGGKSLKWKPCLETRVLGFTCDFPSRSTATVKGSAE